MLRAVLTTAERYNRNRDLAARRIRDTAPDSYRSDLPEECPADVWGDRPLNQNLATHVLCLNRLNPLQAVSDWQGGVG